LLAARETIPEHGPVRRVAWFCTKACTSCHRRRPRPIFDLVAILTELDLSIS
jgi:hypothetical protein